MNLDRILKDTGFVLARQRKHKVYKNDEGKTFVVASTPSDVRAVHKSLSTLCRLIGAKKADLLRRRPKVETPVVIAPVESSVVAVPEIAVPIEPAPVPPSADELLLRRWEKSEAKKLRRKERLEAQRRLTQTCSPELRRVLEGMLADACRMEARDYLDLWAKTLYLRGQIRAKGWRADICACEVKVRQFTEDGEGEVETTVPQFVVQVRDVYLDPWTVAVHTKPKWWGHNEISHFVAVTEVVGVVTDREQLEWHEAIREAHAETNRALGAAVGV